MGDNSKSGWETADSIASGLGKAARGTGWVIIKLYAIALIAIGVFGLVAFDSAARWGSLLFIGYGLYLLFGGTWVIW